MIVEVATTKTYSVVVSWELPKSYLHTAVVLALSDTLQGEGRVSL